MHLIERAGCMAELDELSRQWRIGALTNTEYHTAFAQVDAANSHGLRCTNGDGRIAVVNLGGRLLCSICGRQTLIEARA